MPGNASSTDVQKPMLLVGLTFWRRVAFRFAFCFWTMFCLSQNLVELALWFWPWMAEKVDFGVNWPIRQLALWTGQHVFHLSGVFSTFHPTGSGDTALRWINFLILLALSFVGSMVWTIIDEASGRHPDYRSLYQWLRLGMRFVLATILLLYGFDKIFPLQFPVATGERLTVTYADSSPMGLLWRFMGSSALYRIFGGLAEVIPGLLLLFRRTTTVGAMGAAAVMVNVVALNFGYDVSVKLYSCELLLMALFLLLPDLAPMWQFFVKRQDTRLPDQRIPAWDRRAFNIAAHCVQALTISYVLFTSGVSAWKTWHDGRTPIAGAWMVDAASGALQGEHWTSLFTGGAGRLHVASGTKGGWLKVKIDVSDHTLAILGDLHDVSAGEKKTVGDLRWTPEQNGVMQLTGTWHGQPAGLTLHRVTPNSKLETRGFHLVQEFPVNE
jgi:uncharacterized membrane protein YphA (DoxX/SURF4 family)